MDIENYQKNTTEARLFILEEAKKAMTTAVTEKDSAMVAAIAEILKSV